MGDGLVLGAYALFGGVPDEELVVAYRGLETQPLVSALEMPLGEALGERACLGELRKGLPGVVADVWDVVITCVPTVMSRLMSDPHYGLASESSEGRLAAVADVRRALELARAAADHSGRRRIRAIEVQSAPRRALASAAALEASLTELLGIETAGTVLAVEHCDAPRPGRRPQKGFLEITEELEVIAAIDDERLGLSVNWGRSAIEGCSTRTPPEHCGSRGRSGAPGRADVLGGERRRRALGHPVGRRAHRPSRGRTDTLGLEREPARRRRDPASG